MPVPGAPYDDALTPLLERARHGLPDGTPWFDAHTHTGHNDPDGVTATADELLAGLDRAGVARAQVFTTAEPDGYPPANDRVLAEAKASGGRLVPFCRIDPNAPGPVGEARRCVGLGARGIKLHPRSDRFGLPHPAVEALVVFAEEHRLPVLFHAGRGIPALGAEVTRLAGAHPGARLILAHAGISDLGLLAPVVAGLPNLFFDTSWWQVSDLLALLALVPPGQILYASDMPYGSGRFAALAMLRCARELRLSDEAIVSIAGAQAERLAHGDEPLDAGPAPGAEALGTRWLAGERIVAYASAAAQLAFRAADPTEALALGRLACQVPTGDAEGDEARLLTACDRLLAAAQDAVADVLERERGGDGGSWSDPRALRRAAYPALVAQILAGTPRVPA